MRDLVVITPTRGRRAGLLRLAAAMKRTCTADTQLCIAIDDDDHSYDGLMFDEVGCWTLTGPRRTCADWSNCLASMLTGEFRYLASLGDDHVPETHGWDSQLIGVIEEHGGTGIAYGNDLLMGSGLPTAPLMSADIVQALGWMFLPTSTRLFCDNVWKDLGSQAGCLYCLPDVIIRHLHYSSGLAPRDQTAIDAEPAWPHDEAAYRKWQQDDMGADVAKVRALLT